MARFNASKYDPRIDSSKGTKALRSSGLDGVLLKVADGECVCGCGDRPKRAGSKFVQGHDARLRGILTRAHLTGHPVTLVRGDEVTTTSAEAVAVEHRMEHHLAAAADRGSGKFVQPADGMELMSGPKVGDLERIKVGRWGYDATVLKVTDDEIVYEYETQNGPRTVATARS